MDGWTNNGRHQRMYTTERRRKPQMSPFNTVSKMFASGQLSVAFKKACYSTLLHLPPPYIQVCRRMLALNPGLLRHLHRQSDFLTMQSASLIILCMPIGFLITNCIFVRSKIYHKLIMTLWQELWLSLGSYLTLREWGGWHMTLMKVTAYVTGSYLTYISKISWLAHMDQVTINFIWGHYWPWRCWHEA